MIRTHIIFFILISSLFSGIEEIYETRFEKFWKKTFNKLNYREPVKFRPYTLKFGYFSYGGIDYWNNIGEGTTVLETSPYTLYDADFPDINDIKYRKGFSVELDLLSYNFFHKYQNIIDILIGLGYKYKKSTRSSYYQDIVLKPSFQGWNINTIFLKQWTPNLATYLNFSYGLTKAKFYETPNGNSTGKGTTKGISLGFNFIKSDFNYGLEINFEENKIDDILEPFNYQKIKKFQSREIGIVYFIGIGYGGNKTNGDKAYSDILNGQFISALENLQSFQYKNPYHSKDEEIQKMMMICREEIPQQLYEVAMKNYFAGNLDQAILLLSQAQFSAESKLNFEIESKKFIIANDMIQKADIIIKNFSIDEKINFYKKIRNISHKIENEIDELISLLLIEKGTLFINENKYVEGYSMYMSALDYDIKNEYVIKIKIDNMVTVILNDVYKFLQINEHVIAYELLSYIENISRYDENSKVLMDIVLSKLEDEKLKGMRDRVKKIINNEKQFAIKADPKDIFLGDSFDSILGILNDPYKILSKEKLDNEYDMIFIIINEIKYRLFFKNEILIDVERES